MHGIRDLLLRCQDSEISNAEPHTPSTTSRNTCGGDGTALEGSFNEASPNASTRPVAFALIDKGRNYFPLNKRMDC